MNKFDPYRALSIHRTLELAMQELKKELTLAANEAIAKESGEAQHEHLKESTDETEGEGQTDN